MPYANVEVVAPILLITFNDRDAKALVETPGSKARG